MGSLPVQSARPPCGGGPAGLVLLDTRASPDGVASIPDNPMQKMTSTPRRFFSDSSFWNQPIPANPAIDPRSDFYMRTWAMEPTGGLHLNMHEFTIPVYQVDASTPVLQVAQLPTPEKYRSKAVNRAWEFRHGPGFGRVPIPGHAIPDPAGDKHAAFVDYQRGLAWDMWYALKREDGSWESWTGMHYSIDGPGVFHPSDFAAENGDSIHFHGPGRAAGVPIIAGLAMQHEILAGRIEHKLAFAARYNGYQVFTFPATWTDGRFVGGLPEGAVVQLDPGLNLAPFNLSPAAQVLCRALQEYGMVNVDGAGGTVLYLEGLYGDPVRSWDGILDDKDELKRIPVEHFRVLRIDSPVQLGDGRVGLKCELPPMP